MIAPLLTTLMFSMACTGEPKIEDTAVSAVEPSSEDTDTEDTQDSDTESDDTADTDPIDTSVDTGIVDTGVVDTAAPIDTGTTTEPGPNAVADFSLPDINPASPTLGQNISPRDYLQQISGWYFIKAT